MYFESRRVLRHKRRLIVNAVSTEAAEPAVDVLVEVASGSRLQDLLVHVASSPEQGLTEEIGFAEKHLRRELRSVYKEEDDDHRVLPHGSGRDNEGRSRK